MTTDEAVAQLPHMRPADLRSASGCAYAASLMAEDDNGVAINEEFVSSKILELKRVRYPREKFPEAIFTAPFTCPWNLCGTEKLQHQILGNEILACLDVAFDYRLIDTLHDLKIFLLAHPVSMLIVSAQ